MVEDASTTDLFGMVRGTSSWTQQLNKKFAFFGLFPPTLSLTTTEFKLGGVFNFIPNMVMELGTQTINSARTFLFL